MVVCTKMKLLRELTIREIAGFAMMYMVKHPKRNWEKSDQYVCVAQEKAEAEKKDTIAIARGKRPKVKGAAGSILGLILESNGEILQAKLFEAGRDAKADTWYTVTKERELQEL